MGGNTADDLIRSVGYGERGIFDGFVGANVGFGVTKNLRAKLVELKVVSGLLSNWDQRNALKSSIETDIGRDLGRGGGIARQGQPVKE